MFNCWIVWSLIWVTMMLVPSQAAAQQPGAAASVGSKTDAFQRLRQARIAGQLGDAQEAARLARQAQDFAISSGDQLVAAWSHQVLGELAFTAGDLPAARTAYEAALQAFSGLEDKAGIAASQWNLGRLQLAANQPGDAVERLQVAVEAYEGLERQQELAAALADLGAAYRAAGRDADAVTALTRALPLLEEQSEQLALQPRIDLGASLMEAGNLPDAAAQLQRASQSAVAVKNPLAEAKARNAWGMVLQRQGALADAQQQYQLALQRLATLQDAGSLEADVRNNLGTLMHERGEVETALAELQRAGAAYEAAGSVAGKARALYNIGLVHEARGQVTQALAAYEQALALRREQQDRAGAARVLDNIALLHLSQNATEKARAARDEASRLREQ